MLVLSGIKLVNAPGADWIVLSGFVGGGIVFAAWGTYELRQTRRDDHAALATEPPLS